MNIENLANNVSKGNVKNPKSPGSFARDHLFGKDGLNFRDVIDLINPLQHIPIVGRIYRAITNDDIAPGIRIAGGTIFGGPMGAAFAAAGLFIDKTGGALSEKVTSKGRGPETEKSAPAYSIDKIIAQRRGPVNIYNNVNNFDSSQLGLEKGDRLIANRQWPYSMKQSHMPFIKISQLIEDNYRFLENESSRQERKAEHSRIDRRL